MQHFCCAEFQKEVEKLLFRRSAPDVLDRQTLRGSEDSGAPRKRRRVRRVRNRKTTGGDSIPGSMQGSLKESVVPDVEDPEKSELDAIAKLLREQDGDVEDSTEDTDTEEEGRNENYDGRLSEDGADELKQRRMRMKKSIRSANARRRTDSAKMTENRKKRGRRSSEISGGRGSRDDESGDRTESPVDGSISGSRKKHSSSAVPQSALAGGRKHSYMSKVTETFFIYDDSVNNFSVPKQ